MEPAILDAATPKKWWQSKGTIGSIVAVAAIAFGFAGYNIDGELQSDVVNTVTDVVALGGAVLALIGRLVATKEIRG